MRLPLLLITFLTFCITLNAQFAWIPQESGTTERLNDVYFVSATTGWVVGEGGTILKTIDGGENWDSLASEANDRLTSVFFLNDSVGWVAGRNSSPDGVILLKTLDGGMNWTPQTIPGSEFVVNDIAFRDDSVGWLITDLGRKVFGTTDGGATWVEETINNLADASELRTIELTPSRSFIGGQHRINSQNRVGMVIEKDSFNNNEWVRDDSQEILNGDDIRSLFFFNDSVGFAGGSLRTLYKLENTENVGWKLHYTIPDTSFSIIRSITFGDEQTGWIQGNVSNGQTIEGVVYQTANGGDTWTELPRITGGSGINRLFAADTENVYGVGFNGQIVKAGTQTNVREITSLTGISAFPNPMGDQIQVTFTLDESMRLRIDLFNNMGQQVQSLYSGQLLAGAHNFNFNGMDKLSKGVYLLRMQTEGGEVQTIQIVK